MRYSLLADAVVFIHFAFTLFVICGGLLALLRHWVILAHLPALGWGCWIELSGRICPLTPLEVHLRRLAGEAGYAGDFLQHYVLAVLYPEGLTRHLQWGLAAALIVVNVAAYALLWSRWNHRSDGR